nr:DUF1080 domain-containing protein [uncultured Draconibacterium sp.]
MNVFRAILATIIIGSLIQYKSAAQIQQPASAIDMLQGDVLSNFEPVKGWKMVKSVEAIPNKTEFMVTPATQNGGQILNNGAIKAKHSFLVTKGEFKDIKIDLEFMVPKNSNAGVYVMGRYEIQIFGSYGVTEPTFSDLGGIYQSWDPEKEGDLRGSGGVAPMVNAVKAPGEWQTLSIVFRAPRFNKEGIKVENARFISVKVNDILVQDNVEVPGPTRQGGDRFKQEALMGPISIQGNHGPVAIKKYEVTPLEKDPILDIEEKWTTLFNGKDLKGWTAYNGWTAGDRGSENAIKGEEIFKVNNGVIHVYNGAEPGSNQSNANLVSEQSFSIFHLQVEYRWLKNKFQPRTEANRDAGILFHIHTNPKNVWPASIEMQLGDGKSGDKYVTGDIFVIHNSRAEIPVENEKYKPGAPLSLRGMLDDGKVGRGMTSVYAEKELGEWNLAEIIVHGSDKAEYYLNGKLINEVNNMKFEDKNGVWKPLDSGQISLQAEWAELEYRNIRVKKLN